MSKSRRRLVRVLNRGGRLRTAWTQKAKLVGDSIQAGSLCYITPWPHHGGYAEAPAGGLSYLASRSGKQSSIGFQPVSNVADGWFAFLFEDDDPDGLDAKSEAGW